MPQESRFTLTPPHTHRFSQRTADDLNCLRNAQLEPSSKPDRVQANIGSRNQEYANDEQECDSGLQTEQLVAFRVAGEGAITTVQKARYDEGSDASFRRRVTLRRSEEPPTSSMEMHIEHTSTITPSNRSTQKPHSHSRTDETRSAEHTSTVTGTTDETSLPDIVETDEVIGEDQNDHLPPQANILDHIFEPQTPPHIVQQAFQFADQSDVSVTEEELQTFERQTLEDQKHTLKVFFKELVNMELIL